MKKIKPFICLLLSVILMATAVLPSFAANQEENTVRELDKSGFVTDYPFIFVHGMGGWAPGSKVYDISPYWGGGLKVGKDCKDIIEILNQQGIETYAPAVGPLSSAWDRACELYAQLMGTVVDYGEAHSKAHRHDRYGFSYEGKAITGEAWDMKEKLNLVGHSFGGETVRLFTSLLTYGNADEIAATGKDTSALFTGGHGDCIHACVALSSPHNGSQVANYLTDPKIPMFFIALFVNLVGCTFGNDFLVFSLQFSHFGLTPAQGVKRATFNMNRVWDFYKGEDNCGYDLAIAGAKRLNDMIEICPNTYYYSYPTCASAPTGIGGRQRALDTVSPVFKISSMMIAATEGMTVDGIKIEGDWAKNDGIVPLASGICPADEADTARDYEDDLAAGTTIQPGRWYVMDTMYGMDHLDFCGTEDYPTSFEDFYFSVVETVNSR
ncbi:MAG: hypothetical protein PUC33_08570 [Oscillospiraceae bacterium]|nr:hypothetical protein [Oscillospiraceae bacterium]